MIKLRLALLVFLVTLASQDIQAQVKTKFISGEKTEYSINDEFTIQFQLTVDSQSCLDGMAKTGIFSSGLKIVNRSGWSKLKKGVWTISLKCQVTGNRKGFGQLTIVRRTDKQDLFEQVKFKIRTNVASESK